MNIKLLLSITLLLLPLLTLAGNPGSVIYNETNPPLAGDLKKSPYQVYTRHPLAIVWQNTTPKPEELTKKIRLKLTAGESTHLPIYIYSNQALTDLTLQAPSTGMIKSIGHMEYVEKVGHHLWKLPLSGKVKAPLYISKQWPVNVPKHQTLANWVSITIPLDTAAGIYKQQISINHATSMDEDDFVEIEIEVLPFKLVEAEDYFLGLYAWGRNNEVTKKEYLEAYSNMREFGLTTIAIMAEVREKITTLGTDLRINWNKKGPLHKAMSAYKEVDFPKQEVLWLMSGGDGGDLYRWCISDKRPKALSVKQCYQQLIMEVVQYGKEQGWPELILQPVDEPFRKKDRYKIALDTYQWLSELEGVKVEINNLNGSHAGKSDWPKFFSTSSHFAFARGPYIKNYRYDKEKWQSLLSQNPDKTFWFYNADNTGWHPEIMRFWYGFGLWASEGKGFLQWAYQIDYYIRKKNDPDFVYKPNRFYAFYYPETKQYTGGPTPGLIGIQAGINDLRYVLTQQQLLTQCEQASPTAAGVAEDIKADFLNALADIDYGSMASNWPVVGHWEKQEKKGNLMTIGGDYIVPNGLTYKDYDKLRDQLINNIQRLQNTPDCNHQG